MKDLNQLINQSDSELQEQELKGAINKMLDQDLKADIISSLERDHNILKNNNIPNVKSGSQISRIFYLKRIVGAAAIFILLFSAYFYMTSTKDTMSLANQFAYNEIVTHPGLLKGVNDPDEIRKEAIQLFNNHNWSAAAEKFGSFSTPTAESVYYQSMALFYNKNYTNAIARFQNKLLANSVFVQEVRWFLGLSYFLIEDNEKGKEVFDGMKVGDWNYAKSRKLLE